MKFLKPVIIGLFAFFALSLNAQTSGTNSATARYSQERVNYLATELSLTSMQITQIQDLNEMVIIKIEAIQNNADMTPAKKGEFINGNHEDHKRMMAQILDPDQFAAYENLLKAKASSRTEKRMEIQDVKKTN